MENSLTPARRRELRATAHHLHPVVAIGQHGLTPAVLHEIDVALAAHELIKVRAFIDDRAERDEVLSRVCQELDALPVQHLGKMLILWRAQPQVEAPARKAARPGKGTKPARPRGGAKPAARDPVGHRAPRPIGGKPAARKSTGGKPAARKSAAGKPAESMLAGRKPAVRKSAGGQPAASTFTGGKPAGRKSAAGKPAYRGPAGGAPAPRAPAAGKPATRKTTGGRSAPSGPAPRSAAAPKSRAPAAAGVGRPGAKRGGFATGGGAAAPSTRRRRTRQG